MAIIRSPFESEFGFRSPSFTVDEDGNITANSITIQGAVEEEETQVAADFSFEEVGGKFRLEGNATDNPTIILYRGGSVTIDLDFTFLSFNIFRDDLTTKFNSGIRHDDGTSGEDAQGKSSGRLYVSLPTNAPNTLYYANASGTVFGTIDVQDPEGLFSNVNITSGTASTSETTGALKVSGGIGVTGDLNLGGDLNLQGLGVPKLISGNNLELGAVNKIIIKVGDVVKGSIDTNGSSIPVNSTTINNTTIGATTPSTAAFTSATITNKPTLPSNVTNKDYVDVTATALAITFGI